MKAERHNRLCMVEFHPYRIPEKLRIIPTADWQSLGARGRERTGFKGGR